MPSKPAKKRPATSQRTQATRRRRTNSPSDGGVSKESQPFFVDDELALFSEKPNVLSIDEEEFISYLPKAPLGNPSEITFEIVPSTDRFLDPQVSIALVGYGALT